MVMLRVDSYWLDPGVRMGKGKYVKGSAVCMENIATIILITTSSLVLSVAVHSMKMSVVSIEIFE